MNQTMINNWNNCVKEDDTVFFLGDFNFKDEQKNDNIRDFIDTLNGNIVFVRGNHDLPLHLLKKYFKEVHQYLEINVKDEEAEQGWQHIILFHHSIEAWDRQFHGSWHLFGHSHGTLPYHPDWLSFDVGVDCHNFTPLSYNQVKEIMGPKYAEFQKKKQQRT